MRHLIFALLAGLILMGGAFAQNDGPEHVKASRCHAYIDLEYIWTFEMVEQAGGGNIPILNIITFGDEGEYPLRPQQISIYDSKGRRADVEKLSIDTGVDGDPYVTSFLTVLPASFIGMDLEGDFSQFSEPERVVIELGESEYQLQALDCLDFEGLAEKINQINFNSPDIREDFEILRIQTVGNKAPKRKGRR